MLKDPKCSLCENDSAKTKKIYYQVGEELWRAVDVCAECHGHANELSNEKLQEKLKAGLKKKVGYVPVHLERAQLQKFFADGDKDQLAAAEVYNKSMMKARVEQVKTILLKGM